MLHNGVYFHNVSELEQRPGLPGLLLQRFPREVREALSAKGRTKAAESSGCEIRFVTEAPYVRVTIGALEKDGRVYVFRGDFFHFAHDLKAGTAVTLQLEEPERFPEVHRSALQSGAFSSDVWRICCDRFTAVFYDADAFGYEVRPPHKAEMPPFTLLAYGSSITQGAGSLNHTSSYVQQAARRLGADVINLGLSGTCYCEKEAADHLARSSGWDAVFLELGVNMRSVMEPPEFGRRITYLLDEVTGRNPHKPVFVTTIYPNRATFFEEEEHVFTKRDLIFNDMLRRYVSDRNHPRLYLLEGSEIMTEFVSLTTDLIHPSDYGHIRMGEHLARLLEPVLTGLRTSDRETGGI
ncbi:SGNH/GDSL hydrolase family protein [Paenibacillus sp. 1P03SA]|uniref:SGNH/GDSL hydrolase family protein n=1 Tax=Paenibacillus sp. 1P03SA TaxID=3132294 RepID=UPI0039A19791